VGGCDRPPTPPCVSAALRRAWCRGETRRAHQARARRPRRR
jgi:hypothetical protein